jgi:hypothetical protein
MLPDQHDREIAQLAPAEVEEMQATARGGVSQGVGKNDRHFRGKRVAEVGRVSA